MFSRFVLSMTYYGLVWNLGNLGGSVYINMAVAGVVEIVSFSMCVALLDRLGRRLMCAGLLVMAGLSCSATVGPIVFGDPCKFRQNKGEKD
jgi:hypothetical protein